MSCKGLNFGHNFIIRKENDYICSLCGVSQRELSNPPKKAKVEYKPPALNKNIHSSLHDLVNEISAYFDERKKFGMWLGVIKRCGQQKAREFLSEMRQEENKEPKIFMYKCKKYNEERKGIIKSL